MAFNKRKKIQLQQVPACNQEIVNSNSISKKTISFIFFYYVIVCNNEPAEVTLDNSSPNRGLNFVIINLIIVLILLLKVDH